MLCSKDKEVGTLKNRILDSALTILVAASVFFMLTTTVYADLGDTTLRKGMKHPDVAALQEKLSILGYFDGEEFVNDFGPKTEAALKAFQEDCGIKQDGVAGKETFKLLNVKIKQYEIHPENFEPLKEGDSGDGVADIQEKLKNLELYTAEISSVFDQATIDAVIEFQKVNSLPQTGIVDSATIIKLNTASEKKIADRASASRRIVTAKAIDYAKKFLGAPYKWGASSGKAFDCSGFVVYVMKKFNVNLDRTASGQFQSGEKVQRNELQAGDLVFFTTYKKGPSHVGIYIGDNKFIHASSGAEQVTITDLNTKYYKSRYLGARRYELTDTE
jgi:cell wall-associated NlpC family hydrolase